MSDNFRFDMTGVSLPLALDVAFGQHKTAVAWAELTSNPSDAGGEWGANQSSKRLVLFWTKHKDAILLPAPMNAEGVHQFVTAWLETTNYGQKPDHDGDNERGCRVYNEGWGHVANMWEAFVAIEPVWLLHGK